MIPEGIPTIVVKVTAGIGGPLKDSIPVYDRIPPGSRIGYLKNDTLVRIVDPNYPGKSRYYKTWNNSVYVAFNHPSFKEDCFCEATGHLVPFIPEIGSGDPESFEVISDIFQDGKRVIKVLKLKS
jgi:hypothetical protein